MKEIGKKANGGTDNDRMPEAKAVTVLPSAVLVWFFWNMGVGSLLRI